MGIVSSVMEGGCQVYLSSDVANFLEEQEKNTRAHVRALTRTLEALAERGQMGMPNSEQFRREGKFSCGTPDGRQAVVYAVKAFKLRLYGGFRNTGGSSAFFCVEATKKKKDKADQAQLNRVAKELGALND